MSRYENSGSESRLGDQIATLISTTSFGCLSTEGLRNVIAGGSLVVFTKPGIRERIILQPEGSKAKAYQVRQVRAILLKEQ